MTETIESFVAKIQADGVSAGQNEAEKIKSSAEKQAEQIISDAQEKSKKIISDAEKQAEQSIEKGQTELKLAARDIIMRLRDTLAKVLTNVLAQDVKKELSDTGFLGNTLHELVMLYAKNDLDNQPHMTINVQPEKRQELIDWAMKEIGKQKSDKLHTTIQLDSTLEQAGFTYEIHGANYEVTVQSVVRILDELINPRLRELVEQATEGDEKQK